MLIVIDSESLGARERFFWNSGWLCSVFFGDANDELQKLGEPKRTRDFKFLGAEGIGNVSSWITGPVQCSRGCVS